MDLDEDGVPNCNDCDDLNPSVNPEAEEQCDGIDNDCDGSVDENDAVDVIAWYPDGDGDGYGSDALGATAV